MASTAIESPPRARQRASVPEAEQLPRRSARGRHLLPVAACYVGLIAIVTVTVLLHSLLPKPVGAVIFLVAVTGCVALFHPRITLRR